MDDAADGAPAIELAKSQPSGDVDDESTELGRVLQVEGVKDGPLLISGNFSIIADSGRTRWQGQRAALCRCGASANKPFCDGTHKKVGFKTD